ncbi:DNA repair protein RecO [Candidatus Saccharibacteria bacterium]|nr:DNA repair protein RecO [Candidatus Saccharibacteria bacterium]
MQGKDEKTLAYVLKRTNYGEADRILNIITPTGKKTVMARGVRKEKSKLAGGIEMFSLTELNVHYGKGEFGLVTGAKMKTFYSNLLVDLERMELAAAVLKKINVLADSSDNPEHFEIVDQVLKNLNAGVDGVLADVWFLMNVARASGEEINLYYDADGNKLLPDKKYEWSVMEKSLVERASGEITANEIKMMRLLIASDLGVVAKVKDIGVLLPKIYKIAKSL